MIGEWVSAGEMQDRAEMKYQSASAGLRLMEIFSVRV